MAQQLQVAYSDVFSGMGSVAGGPFLCADGSVIGAFAGMRAEPAPQADYLIHRTETLAEHGLIAPLTNLKRARFWLFHGAKDRVVSRATVDAQYAYNSHFAQPDAVKLVGEVDVEHAMPTDGFHDVPARPGLETCITNAGYDAAGELLTHLYGPLRTRVAPTSPVVAFDQRDFVGGAPWHGMSTTGYVYIPSGAREGRTCRLHVALHGCGQQEARIGRAFAEGAGYNGWAEANDIIVLYPQAHAISHMFFMNTKGSFDWFGYDSVRYYGREARQQKGIVGMVDCLSGGRIFAGNDSPVLAAA
ncbi:hypothetical protein [Paraburkholderia sp. UCT31]|uniref:hypothetical protein n=1 Tax=Paraburkholderia sp. UCT31 TaxID=2615209 RepID=UPI003975767B